MEKLADAPLADLQAKSAAGELNGNYFDSLVSDDLVDDLLSWLSHPKETRNRWEPGRWETLCSRCLADYGFDPARDGELVGAEKLGTQPKAVWKTAWKRYAVAPARYPGLEALLRKAKPPSKGSLFVHAEEFWPQDNEAEEAELRKELLELPSAPVASARQTLIGLEQKHGSRREWVWAKLNQSPLASAIQHLATLADGHDHAADRGDAGRHGEGVHRRGLEGRCRRAGCPRRRHQARRPGGGQHGRRPRLSTLAA